MPCRCRTGRALILASTLALACSQPATPTSLDSACAQDWDALQPRPIPLDAAWAEEDGVCFSGTPPAVDAYVADIARPPTSRCPAFPAPVCVAGSAVPPSLAGLEILLPHDSTATEASPWLGIQEGSQGYAHVDLSLRGTFPPPLLAQRMVRARAWLCVDGRVIGVENRQTLLHISPDGTYTDGDADLEALRLVIPTIPPIALGYCGSWATVRLQVEDEASGAWGETAVPVRLYGRPFPLPHP